MRYTINERKEIYIRARQLIKAGQVYYACIAIHRAAGKGRCSIQKHFPEFWAQKPPEVLNFFDLLQWWPADNKQARLDALDKAIELCNNTL